LGEGAESGYEIAIAKLALFDVMWGELFRKEA